MYEKLSGTICMRARMSIALVGAFQVVARPLVVACLEEACRVVVRRGQAYLVEERPFQELAASCLVEAFPFLEVLPCLVVVVACLEAVPIHVHS